MMSTAAGTLSRWAIAARDIGRAEGVVTMKRVALALTLLVLLLAAYLRTTAVQGGPVRQLAPGVFSRNGDKDARQPANTSWVEFKTFVVVIDANTPWGIRAVLPEIRKTTSKPV